MIRMGDGTQLFYKDWGSGQPVLFSHGWPLCSDAWDNPMLFFLQNGFRVIAHDRRGHGRSSQTWEGNTMDQFASDLHELIEHLQLKEVVLIGHSTGGGEVTRYLGRYGCERVAQVVLVSAIPPLMLKTEKNPGGLPREVFDKIREGTLRNRSQYFKDLAAPFFGFNRNGSSDSEGVRDSFWYQGMMGGVKAIYDCIEQFSETDLTEDLRKIRVPTLILHGDDDQIVPIGASARMSSQIIPSSELRVYPGAPHGLPITHAEEFNRDVLSFIQKGKKGNLAA